MTFQWAMHAHLGLMAGPGVKVYYMQPPFDHSKLIGIERETIFAGQIAARCDAAGGEPVHHRPHIPAGWSTDETHRGQLVMIDDSEDAIGFGFARASIDHPMITLHDLPAPAELGDR
jgi:hypothetical protein